MKSDVQLKQDVENELRWDPSVHEEKIGVSVKNGVVEMDGHVDSYYEKCNAEDAALRVGAVKAIANELKVDWPGSLTRTDEDIARTAMNSLDWNYSVPNTVKVKVADGFVTLSGTVDWEYQKEDAEGTVRPLIGVKGVINEIVVKPKVVNPIDVKIKIQDALKRNAMLDADAIQVETSGTRVILRGSVQSWAERDEAEDAAWAAPGVTNVEDLITIS